MVEVELSSMIIIIAQRNHSQILIKIILINPLIRIYLSLRMSLKQEPECLKKCRVLQQLNSDATLYS